MRMLPTTLNNHGSIKPNKLRHAAQDTPEKRTPKTENPKPMT
jgi:hypothetical protein